MYSRLNPYQSHHEYSWAINIHPMNQDLAEKCFPNTRQSMQDLANMLIKNSILFHPYTATCGHSYSLARGLFNGDLIGKEYFSSYNFFQKIIFPVRDSKRWKIFLSSHPCPVHIIHIRHYIQKRTSIDWQDNNVVSQATAIDGRH